MNRILSAATLSPLALLCLTDVHGQAESTPRLETITVTGTASSLEQARAEVESTPGGATLIDIEGFRERHVGNLADVLRYVPGIWAASDTGSDDIFFSSRGSNLDATDWDMNGIRMLQDGLPVTAGDGNNHNRVIDPLAARHATVARGANAMTYGASTLGGAVDFVTPTARDESTWSASVNAGSYGQALGRFTYGEVFGERFDALLTVEGRRRDGYREHSRQRRAGLYANAGWQVGEDVATRFYATVLSNEQELPGALSRRDLEIDPDAASVDAIDGHYQLGVDTRRLANRTTWRIDADRQLDFGVSVEVQSLFHPIVWVAEDFDGPGPEPETELFSLLIDSEQRDLGAMLRYRGKIGHHQLLFGLNHGGTRVRGGNYRNFRGTPNGLTEHIANDAATTELFVTDRWQAAPRTIVLLAAQTVSAEREARTTSAVSAMETASRGRYEAVNPRVGVIRVFAGGDAAMYGNISRLFEPPTNYELEDNVAGGNAALRPMEGSVIEIGGRGERTFGDDSAFAWDVSLYHARIDDEILSVEDPDAPGTSLATNVDATIHAGVEALFRATLARPNGAAIEPLASLTINDFRFDGDPVYDRSVLPAAPRYFFRGELVYRSRAGFHVGPTVDFVGRRWADFANTYRIDAYSTFGLRAGWTRDRWQVYAELRNLGDEEYVASHSVRNRAAAGERMLHPGEPRSAYIGATVRFD